MLTGTILYIIKKLNSTKFGLDFRAVCGIPTRSDSLPETARYKLKIREFVHLYKKCHYRHEQNTLVKPIIHRSECKIQTLSIMLKTIGMNYT